MKIKALKKRFGLSLLVSTVGVFCFFGVMGVQAQMRSESWDGELAGHESEGGCYSTCGGDVPWPFELSNQTAELADGERYLLFGRVEIQGGQAYFVVDLARHPWLASAKRKRNPKYQLISGDLAYWQTYLGRSLRVAARARWQIIESLKGASKTHKIEVMLESFADPAVLRGGSTQPPR
jgi:hypothetical protein